MASLVAQTVKNLPAMQETQEIRFNPWVKKIPWRRKWQLTPVFLPEESHGQRSLVATGGYISTATGLGSFQNHVMEGECDKRIRYKT